MSLYACHNLLLTSLFSLVPGLKSALPADAANIDQLLGQQSIVGSTMDIWGSTEANNAGNALDVLPVYSQVAIGPGNSVQVCSIDDFGSFNRLSNRRFVRFDIASPGTYRIRATGLSSTDPDLFLYRQGVLNSSEGLAAGTETLTQTLVAGTHVVEVYDACIVFGALVNPAVCPDPLPSRSCLDVTVEPL